MIRRERPANSKKGIKKNIDKNIPIYLRNIKEVHGLSGNSKVKFEISYL